ncbi:TPA: hypothetical protein HA265_04440 [Candidatus Woesearchaeota archaeon]|nr:hypothetical protein [Candidatus Woesearchaeota archaeon]
MSLEEIVDTAEFRRSSILSRGINWILKHTILPQFPKEHMDSYLRQWEPSSRNVEIALEGLLKLARRPRHCWAVLSTLKDWGDNYFPNADERPRYLINTQHDEKIPFRGEADIMYVYMIAQIGYVANGLAENTTIEEMRTVAQGFKEMNRTGGKAFSEHPSVMPRVTEHDRLSLRAAQKLDKPYNACPSLHIAYSIYMDNVAGRYLKDRDMLDSIRKSAKAMLNSVLYVKQHSILDVAFGIMCARIVYEKTYGEGFNDFTEVFDELREEHPTIDYDEISSVYREIEEIREKMQDKTDLAGMMGTYLKRHGYKKIRPEEDVNNAYFDTERREIIFKNK